MQSLNSHQQHLITKSSVASILLLTNYWSVRDFDVCFNWFGSAKPTNESIFDIHRLSSRVASINKYWHEWEKNKEKL